MDIASLLTDSSRYTIDHVTEKVYRNPELVYETFKLAVAEKGKRSQRASRVICTCADRKPDIIKPYLSEILKILQASENDSILMNFMKIFTAIPLPDDDNLLGILADRCFSFIESSAAKVGLKVYSLETLYRICCREPEMKNELILIIEDQIPKNDFAFKSRGERIIKILNK